MQRTLLAFYTLLVTQTISLLGSHRTTIGVGIWLFRQTGQATLLLLTPFFAELPGMLDDSLAGVLADRWDRKRVLILADAGQALGSLALALSFLTGRFQVWHLYLVVLVQGTFALLQQPAEDAITTLLVPETGRECANGIWQMAFPLAGVVAPVLAGLAYTMVVAAQPSPRHLETLLPDYEALAEERDFSNANSQALSSTPPGPP